MSLILLVSTLLLSSLSLVFLFFLYEMFLFSSLNLPYYIDLIRIVIFLIAVMVLKDPYWYITNLILIICLVLYLTFFFRSGLLGVLFVVVIILLPHFAHDSLNCSLNHRMSLSLIASTLLLSSLPSLFSFLLYERSRSPSLFLYYCADLIRISVYLVVVIFLEDRYWYIMNLILIICLVLYLTFFSFNCSCRSFCRCYHYPSSVGMRSF